MMTLRSLMTHTDPHRIAALALATGLAVMGLDAAISHFAANPFPQPAQYVPVVYGLAAFVALSAVALSDRAQPYFRTILRWLGGSSMFVGAVGTAFHLRGLGRLLESGASRWADLEAALAVAPPLFAPGAFVALGGLVWLLGNRRFQLAFAV